MKLPEQIGVGLQYNPEILGWFPFEEQKVDLFEILIDSVMGPLDSPYLFRPGTRQRLEKLRSLAPLLVHSNYGCEFGFGPLDKSAAVRRHVGMTKILDSPWVGDHGFYGDDSWFDVWSSPIQFSNAEVIRVADRARQLQDLYERPLAHENAAYYMATPGAEMREAEFLAKLCERAGTFLHLDLHNIYTNAINLPNYDLDDYLATVPLDRIACIHLGGGSWWGEFYHDWHDNAVPNGVWDLLDHVLKNSKPGAVVLEYQGRAHHSQTRILEETKDKDMIVNDLARARAVWARTQCSTH